MKKVINVLQTIFSIGIIACLLAGALSLVGYIIALFIGGSTATDMCSWIFKTYLPWVIRITAVVSLIGLVILYMTKQKVLSVSNDEKVEDNELVVTENK